MKLCGLFLRSKLIMHWTNELKTINLQRVGCEIESQQIWATIIMDSKIVFNENTENPMKSEKLSFFIYQATFFFPPLSLSKNLPLHKGFFFIIYLFFNHLNSTLVIHLRFHLSVCPIGYVFQFFVSRSNQSLTVQMSFPHKCSLESSYSAFNAVAATFSQIFWALPTFLSNPQDTSSSLELLRRVLQWLGCKFEVCQSCPRVFSSSDAPPRASHLRGSTLDLYYVLAISSNGLSSSDRPMAQHINLGLYPHNSPSKLRFLLTIREENAGFDLF